MSKEYILLQKVGTQEYFYFMSEDDFITKLLTDQQSQQLLDLINKLGYKEYKDSYDDLLIKTKTCEVHSTISF